MEHPTYYIYMSAKNTRKFFIKKALFVENKLLNNFYTMNTFISSNKMN